VYFRLSKPVKYDKSVKVTHTGKNCLTAHVGVEVLTALVMKSKYHLPGYNAVQSVDCQPYVSEEYIAGYFHSGFLLNLFFRP
jgi:hypothetical protein